MMTPEKLAVKERLAARTKAEMDALWNDAEFRKGYYAWRKEYRAAAEKCKAIADG